MPYMRFPGDRGHVRGFALSRSKFQIVESLFAAGVEVVEPLP